MALHDCTCSKRAPRITRCLNSIPCRDIQLQRPVADRPKEAKRTHLLEFWKQVMKERPMTLVGASLGGAVALDFAHEFPEAVRRLVLIDAQGFIDGAGPAASLPEPLVKLGISVLGSKVTGSSRERVHYP